VVAVQVDYDRSWEIVLSLVIVVSAILAWGNNGC
jgi:hypothetical protein